jgi:hypothetical protein
MGIRIMSHGRGNPETEVGRTPNAMETTRKATPPEKEKGKPKASRESDSPTVLRDGKADHMGKGRTGIRSL